MKALFSHISKLWATFIGDVDRFPIETRIFHAVVMLASVLLFMNGVIACCIGLQDFVIYTFGFIPVFWVMYYLSRFKRRANVSITIFGILANADCIFSYFYAGGISGTNMLSLLAISFILCIVCPKSQIKFWIPFNCVVMIGLLVLEFYHPEWLGPPYTDRATMLIDQGQTYFMLFALVTIVTFYIKENYHREKRLADVRELELIKLNETKDKLFSIVAHDLRAPLASVQSYLELLKQVYLTEEEKEHILNNLLKSTKSTSEMLGNILSWTKAQMNGVSLNFVRVNLERALHNTVELHQHMAREKGVELIIPERSDLQLIADPDMLQLVVRNLISNAIKFTPAGGRITVSYESREDECCIIIQDTGIGIAEEFHQEMFSLKSQSTFGTNNEKGVGLGLLLSKSYVELQNGKIWFESAVGKGTTFFLSFSMN